MVASPQIANLRDQSKAADSDLPWQRDAHVSICARAASSTKLAAEPGGRSSFRSSRDFGIGDTAGCSPAVRGFRSASKRGAWILHNADLRER